MVEGSGLSSYGTSAAALRCTKPLPSASDLSATFMCRLSDRYGRANHLLGINAAHAALDAEDGGPL